MSTVPQRNKPLQLCRLFLISLVLVLAIGHVASAEMITQRTWMATLVDTLGRSFGLPDEPQDPDYINILQGGRSFRFEAEDVYTPEEDEVALMAFRNFGEFSGRGWLQGVSRPTQVHLRFTLPLSGDYQMAMVVRRGEHGIQVGSSTFTANAGERFERIDLGQVSLSAGPNEVLVTLAPAGAIDYLELIAPAWSPISPQEGWQPDEPLRWEEFYTTLVQALDLGSLLPLAGTGQQIEAESLSLSKEARATVVDIAHLGKPSAGKWVRAGAEPASLRYPITLRQGSFYDLSLRLLGDPVAVTINDHQTQIFAGQAYLGDYQLDTFFLFKGRNSLRFELPPGGGLDMFTLTPRSATTAAVGQMLGLGQSTAAPDSADLDRAAKLLAAFAPTRR